jgi:hypothetical protein
VTHNGQIGKEGFKKQTKAKVVKVPLPAQAALDFPDAIWEKSGSKEYERLKEKRTSSKKKLNALEEYLCLKYFPAQQKRVQGLQIED